MKTVFTLGLLTGLAAGYFGARAALQQQYDERLDAEVSRTKAFFGAQYEGSKEGLDDPEFMEAAIDAAESMKGYVGGITVSPAVLAAKVEASVANADTTNPAARAQALESVANRVPYNRPSTPDTKASRDAREPDGDPHARAPFIITFEEFDANETGADQITVSYFAGDGIVIDEEDEVIPAERVEETIGTDNLNRFGTNTEDPNFDPNTLYIRCEKSEQDYEVTRSHGKYSVDVLGEAG